MASKSIGGAIVCSFDDATGEARVNGRTYRWEFHDYLGPTFLKADWDTPLVRQPGEKHPVWDAFDKWLVEYQIHKATEQVPYEQRSAREAMLSDGSHTLAATEQGESDE